MQSNQNKQNLYSKESQNVGIDKLIFRETGEKSNTNYLLLIAEFLSMAI